MATETSLFRAANASVDGRLAEIIYELRGATEPRTSWSRVSKQLLVQHGLDLSDDTLRAWFAIDEPPSRTEAAS